MLILKEKMKYKAFGLSIVSEIIFPELPKTENEIDFCDIEIKKEDLSKLWNTLSGKDFDFVIDKNLVIFKIPTVGIFSIRDGKFITVSPMNEADEDIIRIFILGTCMGAILMQKRILPLHGSAVAINGKAYAIVGESGAGKSTLAAAFLSAGYKLLSDDVISITLFPEENIPYVSPAYPQQKLWQDSLKSLGMKVSEYQSIFGRENKYCIPISSDFLVEPLPLGGIFELIKTEDKEIHIRPIDNLDRFHTLFMHTYRNFFIERLGLIDWHFSLSTNIIQNVEIHQLQRPISGFNVFQLVHTILDTINKGD